MNQFVRFRGSKRLISKALRCYSAPVKQHSSSITLYNGILLLGIVALGPAYYLLKPKAVNKELKDEKITEAKLSKKDVQRIEGVPFAEYVIVGGGTASYQYTYLI
jgi:hypothetical protein